MNIGKNIKKIREDNGLSQEQLGKMFFVTRQTVSNWENEKSYPDLNTIVKLSDTFNISLDKLLKEDPEMVQNISKTSALGAKWSRLKRIAFVSICLLIAATVITMGVWGAVWHSRKNKLENRFDNAVKELGFSEDTGVFKLSDDDVTYILPNQKMPPYFDFSYDFHAKSVCGFFKTEDRIYTVYYSGEDIFSLEITDTKTDDTTYVNIDKNAVPAKDLNKKDAEALHFAEDKIKTVTLECKTIYDKAYIA